MRRYRELFSDAMVATGAAIVVFSVALVILILITAVPVANPYIGVFAFIFLPVLVITGGILFVFGTVVSRKKALEAPPGRGIKAWLRRYTISDLKQPQNLRRFTFFLAVGVVEVFALSVGGFKLAHYMDTQEFCGQTCHKVMKPEYTVYQASPHARVPCVDCHIGEGASWLVRSKVTGVKQLFAVLADTYPRPIETPVKNLRPARETCEVCHWPQKFSGDIVRVKPHYASDEKNTASPQVLALKVGGGGKEIAEGIHWHVDARVFYLPLDEKRQQVGWVGVEDAGGGLTEYLDQTRAGEIAPDRIASEKRLMDCTDCHNRATHVFRSPDELLNTSMQQGRIDPSIPFIKKEGLDFLGQPDTATADPSVITTFYRENYPQVYDEKKAAIDKAAAEIGRMSQLVSFPGMNVDWTTHPNNIGHTQSPGCFRCHGKLATTDGKTISNDCTLCHAFLPPTILSAR